jgi:hypothetical protein
MADDSDSDIPAPHYSLIETSRGPDPAVIVVNSALRMFRHRDLFPWHLHILIACQLLGDNGMPTADENKILYNLEDEISGHVLANENSVFLARVTCRGHRELAYRVRDPEIANGQVQQLASNVAPSRQWEYRMEHDSLWNLAKPELSLLERDPKFN